MDLTSFIRFLAVLIAAVLLGRWFDTERRKLRAQGKPWYAPWKSLPGILILVVLSILIASRLYLQG